MTFSSDTDKTIIREQYYKEKENREMVRREYNFQTIGNNLKKLRLMNDMTVEDVREYMQLGTVQAIYKWERGDCLPQADSLLALMELYGVNRIDRITGVSEMLAPVPVLWANNTAA